MKNKISKENIKDKIINSKKIAIQSAILPGYGHFKVGRLFRGLIFISAFSYTTYKVMFTFIPSFIIIYNKLPMDLIFEEVRNIDEIKFPIFLLIIWLGSIIDSYLTAEFEIKRNSHD